MYKMNIKKLIITLTSVLAFSVSSASADGHIKYSVTADNAVSYTHLTLPTILLV